MKWLPWKRLRAIAWGVVCTFAAAPQVMVRAEQRGTVEGYVTCSDGNVPARQATVRLVPLRNFLPERNVGAEEGGKSVETTTDFNGYYLLNSVAPGRYVVDVRAAGYADDLELVQTALERLSREQKETLLATFAQVTVGGFNSVSRHIVLHRAGALAGHVSVDTGGLIGPGRVEATLVESPVLGDVSKLSSLDSLSFTKFGEIDDRGSYRISALPSGRYRVSVRLREAFFEARVQGSNGVLLLPRRLGTAELTVYAPDTITKDDAKLINIGEGQQFEDADVTIPLGKLHSIEGVALRAGKEMPGLFIAIQRSGNPVQGMNAISDDQGRFRFDLLPDGTYTLWSNASHPKDLSACSDCQKTTVVIKDHDASRVVLEVLTQWAKP